jgi:hypothetical protein
MVAFNDKKKSTVPNNDKGFGQGSSINRNMPVSPNRFGNTQTPYTANVKSKGGSHIRKPEQPKSIKTMDKTFPPQVPMRGGGKSQVGMPQSKNVATIKNIKGKRNPR